VSKICRYRSVHSDAALHAGYRHLLLHHETLSDVCISVITKAELLYGVEVFPRRQQAELKTAGTMIGANDLLISAHARSLGLTLVMNNTREFGRVRSLATENWAAHS